MVICFLWSLLRSKPQDHPPHAYIFLRSRKMSAMRKQPHNRNSIKSMDVKSHLQVDNLKLQQQEEEQREQKRDPARSEDGAGKKNKRAHQEQIHGMNFAKMSAKLQTQRHYRGML